MKDWELHSDVEKRKRDVFDTLIERRHGTATTPPKNIKQEHDGIYEEYEDDDEAPRFIPEIEDVVDANGRLLNQQPAYDTIINAEVRLQLGEELATGVVARRALGPDGTAVGTYDENPYLNTCLLYTSPSPRDQRGSRMPSSA